MTHSLYQSLFSEKYASKAMLHIFSPINKYTTWRKLWIALAETEKELGLPITDKQIAELKKSSKEVNFENVQKYEELHQHDVIAHIKAFADQCPEAKAIIHAGATSTFVTDNTDLIQMKEGLTLLEGKLLTSINILKEFAIKYAGIPCLSYTHLQAAQLTTVGKRACMWLQDLIADYKDIKTTRENLKFLGVKGATGTQASFLALFKNESKKVKDLDNSLAKKMGFTKSYLISSQTYTRKQDVRIIDGLKGLAISAHKIANDIRLLAGFREFSEFFQEQQVGSSAMPYKKNPILSERICGISRFLISLSENSSYNAASQWLERSLDDSSNRRLMIPEAFLSADAIVELLNKLLPHLEVNRNIILKHIQEELPFLATENILMESVNKGKDRQEIHEKLRVHSMATLKNMNENGARNDLIERLENDPSFSLTKDDLNKILNIKLLIGRAEEQVHDFIDSEFSGGKLND